MMLQFFRNNKYMLLGAVLLVAAGWGGWSYYSAGKQDLTSIKTGTVVRGTLIKSISATGSLSAVDNVDISSKITGRIVDVLVQENQHVSAGDVLVRLDDTALRATMNQMGAKLVQARNDFDRYKNLLGRGAISASDYDQYEANYLVAQSNYTKAASDVADTVITSPIDGYIIGKPTPVGQTISSGISTPQVIMSVATLDDMQIETLVDESDIGQVKVGQKVRFTVDAYNNETFTGKVRLVSRKAKTENNVIYYTVYVSVDDAKGKLLPTMTARAEIVVDEMDDALSVPLNCINVEGKRRYVTLYNTKSKESRQVDIQTGMASEDRVAVVSDDLQDGDVLLARKAVKKQTGVRAGGPRL
ncbi:MAG: efflux RND transporter periplasmic adaptor subunit [Acidaminococcaceae bacterium]|nr:efflux RND transporter periplasmic adaptor subunit [Acidaminococcaceae bacterium]